jgi:hypothetical protein
MSAQGFRPGSGADRDRPEGPTEFESGVTPGLVLTEAGVAGKFEIDVTSRATRDTTRSPFQGEFVAGGFPGLKPWAEVYNRFAVKTRQNPRRLVSPVDARNTVSMNSCNSLYSFLSYFDATAAYDGFSLNTALLMS